VCGPTYIDHKDLTSASYPFIF